MIAQLKKMNAKVDATDPWVDIDEAADLLFHMTILLVDRGYRLEDIAKILADRHQGS